VRVQTKTDAIRGLYAIIDATYIPSAGFGKAAAEVISGGGRLVQVRAKGLSVEDIMDGVREARKSALEGGAIFIVNDSVEVALKSKADGVHLGQTDAPVEEARRVLGHKAIIGISTHNADEALRAEALGADYISLGPVFPTRTKKDAEAPKGLSLLTEVCRAVAIPVVAIGGITEATAPDVIEAGAAAAAIISDILTSGDIKGKVAAIISAINKART